MIVKLLRSLFNSNDTYGASYQANPRHVLYSILLMAAGNSVAYYDGWLVFGIITFLIGVALGITIIFSINWQKCIEYWETINETIKLMQKITNPEVWEALGFKAPAQTIRVIEDLNKEPSGQYQTTNIHHIDFISPVILQSIADAVLSGAPFSEGEIVKKRKIVSSPKFRRLQKLAASKEKGWIKPHNSTDNRQGFALTKKGYSVFYQAASNSVKMRLKEKDGN